MLGEHPSVVAAAVFGLPHPRLGERVVAVVQREGDVSAEALIAHVRAGLARYKTPEDLRFVEEMPRNAMGKIVKGDLEALFS